MINTRQLVNSAIAAAGTVSALATAREKEREAARQEAEKARALAEAERRTAKPSPSAVATVWASTTAGACVAAVMPEPKLVVRVTTHAVQEVAYVRAA